MALVTCKQLEKLGNDLGKALEEGLEKALAQKQDGLNDCDGQALAAGAQVVTCAHLQGELGKALNQAAAGAVKSGRLNGSNLELTLKDDSKVSVPLGGLIPPVKNASATESGVVRLANERDVAAGTDNTKAVTPKGVKGAVDSAVDAAKAELGGKIAALPKPLSATDLADGVTIRAVNGRLVAQNQTWLGYVSDISSPNAMGACKNGVFGFELRGSDVPAGTDFIAADPIIGLMVSNGVEATQILSSGHSGRGTTRQYVWQRSGHGSCDNMRWSPWEKRDNDAALAMPSAPDYSALVDNETIEFKNGKLSVKPSVSAVVPQSFDNGTGTVVGNRYTIDYGNGLIETNLEITYPLATVAGTHQRPPFRIAMANRTSGYHVDQADPTGGRLYHKESRIQVSAASLGMKSIISVSGIAGDVEGMRTEGVWLIQDRLGTGSVWLGVQVLATADQDSVKGFFTIKGLKAD